METYLIPCPECGHEEIYQIKTTRRYIIGCDECEHHVHSKESHIHAVNKWNKQTDEAESSCPAAG